MQRNFRLPAARSGAAVIVRLIAALIIGLASTLPGQGQSLPGTKRDLKFDRKLSKLDLENSSKFEFYYKSGGTSVGFKIAKKGKRKAGVFVPRNSSSIPESEVVSYRLSRLLEVSHLFNPVGYYVLGPKAIRRFRKMIRDNETDRWRRKNANKVQDRLDNNDERLLGIYKFRRKRRTQPVRRLADSNRLNKSHFLARYLLATRERPSSKRVRLRGVTRDKRKYKRPRESVRELARQLSTIFVIDMLVGQWDRFSGGNLEAIAHKNGRLQFIARDNGGASFSNGWKWFERYQEWVSRFDRAFVDRLTALNDFFNGRTASFGAFDDIEALRMALGFRRDSSFESFQDKLQTVADEWLRELKQEHGDAIYFKPPEP